MVVRIDVYYLHVKLVPLNTLLFLICSLHWGAGFSSYTAKLPPDWTDS